MIFSPNVAQTALGAAAWTLGAPENLRKRSSSEAEKAKEKESKDLFFSLSSVIMLFWYNGITMV
jgi:hypothetical protein